MSNLESQAIQKTIIEGAASAFVDAGWKTPADTTPQFISNDHREGRKVLSCLESELAKCSSFIFSVAFITKGGLAPLLPIFRDLEAKGVRGRILTTDYLSFSEPDALRKLAAFSNIEVRMFASEAARCGFHTKGYIFEREDGTYRAYVGSSNLTASALAVNKEWNVKLVSTAQGQAIRSALAEFEQLWRRSEGLADILSAYEAIYREKVAITKSQKIIEYSQIKLEPNAMQARFVANLEKLLTSGARRALLISATGTGKTYASAFALRHIDPKKILFLAHREQVLKQSKLSYQRVFGSARTFGLLSGNYRETDVDCLFATMQTMSKDDVLKGFGPDEFDVIVIDEVHRAGSNSYLKILDHFNPEFCLGMTASPDRPDGFDIYSLFDNNIAYEIRLQQALEEELLCPFHYFGITDFEVDGEVIDEETGLRDFNRLVCDERVDHVIEQAKYYGNSGTRTRGLVFCSNKREARELSLKFNERGLRTVALSGENSQLEREIAIERLEAEEGRASHGGCLDYIFTVDIFNEGVDIPSVNQVIMLRPTESPIVFVQQLGRGLRKYADKEYVVILDFIGNYTNNFMIPIALSGDRSYNKDTIRKYVMEGSRVIPGASTVHFDEVSKRRIFESIDASKTSMKMLKDKYFAVKHKLGKVPSMLDFHEHGEIDPLLFVEKKESYLGFVEYADSEAQISFTDREWTALKFVSSFLANGMRPHELLMLKEIVLNGVMTRTELVDDLVDYGIEELDPATYESSVRMLDMRFINSPSDKNKYADMALLDLSADGEYMVATDSFAAMAGREQFREALLDVIEFGLARNKEKYSGAKDGFVLYEKYTRKDVCRLLNWEKDCSSTMYGYLTKHGTCPIFVTYKKSKDISLATQYDEAFLDSRRFSWMSKPQRTLSSSDIKSILGDGGEPPQIHLFIKKSDDEGSDFYYMGKVFPTHQEQQTTKNDMGEELPIVNLELTLERSVRDDVYEYFQDAV